MNSLTLHIRDEDAMGALAARLAQAAAPGDTILLEGPLGAGKTTFSRYFAWAMGVDGEEPITSPTFALVHEYEARIPLVHADLYRLGEGAALDELGLRDRLGHDVVALVEWGERFEDALAPVALFARIRQASAEDESQRVVTLSPRSPRGEALIEVVRAALVSDREI